MNCNVDPSTRLKLSSGLIHIPFRGLEEYDDKETVHFIKCLADETTLEANKEKCAWNPLIDTWLFILAQSSGYSIGRHTGWHAESPVWITQVSMYATLMAGSAYDFGTVMCTLDMEHLTTRDSTRRFIKDKLYIPVYQELVPIKYFIITSSKACRVATDRLCWCSDTVR